MASYTGLNLTWVLWLVPETTLMSIINNVGQLQLIGYFVQYCPVSILEAYLLAKSSSTMQVTL